MTLTVRDVPTASVDIVAVFQERCWTRARLFAEGELDLHDAVDTLQHDAVRDGLVAVIGQDRVQAMMGDAFGALRKKLTAWELGEAYADHRGILDVSTIAILNSLIQQNDPAQFRRWMTPLSLVERQAVRDLLATA
jgi:hypothetical protein